jgi:hypothetical protein
MANKGIVGSLIHKLIALVGSITVSVVVCAALFGVSTIFDPNGTFFWAQLGYAGFMALVMFIMVYSYWDNGRPKILHEIEMVIFTISIWCSFLFMVGFIIILFGNIFFDLKESYYIPPIIVVTLIIGLVSYKLRDKSLDTYGVRSSSSYTPPSYTYTPPKVTDHYDKYGNKIGESWERK